MKKDVDPGAPAPTAPRGGEDAVLESLRAFRQEEIRREQAMVLLAVEWARLNPAEGRTEGDHLYDSALTTEEYVWDELAQRGCPHVEELSVPAFADAAGMTEFQASNLLRQAIMLVFLLPKVWERTSQGQIEVWRARKLAEQCWDLTPEAIAFVDRNMSLATARHTEGGRDGVIEEARIRYMPEEVEAQEEAANAERFVSLDWEEHKSSGVAAFWGVLDIPDARDLETAIAAGAEAIKDLGSDAPLDVRRSWALGDLARSSQFLDPQPLLGPGITYHPDCPCQQGRPAWNGGGTPTAQVKMYLHLTPDALVPAPGASFAPVRVEGNGIPTGTLLTAETVRGWFTRPGAAPDTRIIFRPVIDLEDHQQVDAYEVPDRIKEHVALRDGGCVFPWCHRKARNADCDHTIPWAPDGSGGPTCSCNLAPLCRRHHRAKTHADSHTGSRYTWWRYEALGEGKYLWEGPNGTRLLRTNTGVYDITAGRVSNGPRTPDRLGNALSLDDVLNPSPVSTAIQARVTAAQEEASSVRATIPAAEEFHRRYPPEPGEEPFVPEPEPRKKSWRQLAPTYYLRDP